MRRETPAGPLRLRLLGRPGCHLCEDLLERARPLVLSRGGTLEEINVDEDPALAARWGNEIPVILDESGRVFARALDDEAKLQRRLAGA